MSDLHDDVHLIPGQPTMRELERTYSDRYRNIFSPPRESTNIRMQVEAKSLTDVVDKVHLLTVIADFLHF